jgi:hypothetical protein
MRNQTVIAVFFALFHGLAFGQAKADEPVKATLCELVNEPARHNGKIVRVRAEVLAGRHGSVLMDQTCKSVIPWTINDKRWPLSETVTEYSVPSSPLTVPFHPDLLDWKHVVPPVPVTLLKDGGYRRFSFYLEHMFGEGRGERCSYCPLYELTATFTARFDNFEAQDLAVRDTPGGPIRIERVGFGRLLQYAYQLVVQSVSDVVAKPIDIEVHERQQ